jgi:arabinogalactan oligomer/maltooligosaccharide transport system permease protein
MAVGLIGKVMGAGNGGALAIIFLTTVCAVVISCILAVINFLNPSKLLVKVWIGTGVVQTAGATVLLFISKRLFDTTGVLSGKFYVSEFGFGYWLLLICSYFALWYAMKTARIHPGYIVLVIMSIIWLFPITWIVLTSLRAESGYYVGYFIPKGFTLDNYIALFKKTSVIPFGKWWMNTFIVASCLTICNTLIILGTAYVFSRTRFDGRTTMMKGMMVIGMFPGFMSLVAIYNILKGVGLAQTLTALIVVGVAGAAMGYLVCKGFFDTIPKAMDEAAIIDGATRWQIFTKITIPLAKPIIIYTALTSFLGPWSDYIFPSMLFGDRQASYTVAVGLKWLTDFQRIDAYYTQFAAGSIMVALPIMILFIALQRFYVEGLAGSVKG